MQLLLIYNQAQTYKNGKYNTLSVHGFTPY
jgi:hypothetical protein